MAFDIAPGQNQGKYCAGVMCAHAFGAVPAQYFTVLALYGHMQPCTRTIFPLSDPGCRTATQQRW